MEDKEYELYELTGSDGNSKTFLSDITVPGGSSGVWFSDIRSYIEHMDLLDYRFDFWNASRGSRIDRKFEKAIKLKGSEVIVLKSEHILGKRARDHEVSFQTVEERTTWESMNDAISERPEEPLGIDRDVDAADIVHNAAVGDIVESRLGPPITDRSIAPEDGGLPRLRSILMFDDVKENWSRAVKGIKRKMEQAGLEDHKWWLETWDEGDKVIVKVWCHECRKWIGTGKPEQHSNTLSNFYRQHVPTALHNQQYKNRVGKDALEAEQEKRRIADCAAIDRLQITDAVAIIQATNERNGSECFVIHGDVTNTRLSPRFYKWQCKYCRVLHHLCPKTCNLASSLDAHLLGERHIRKVAAIEENARNLKPASSGRPGRPSWQVSTVNASINAKDGKRQQFIGAFFSTGVSSSAGSTSGSKGTVNAALVCWGLWQTFVSVDGNRTDIRPFILDQKKGLNWYSEPYLQAEIEVGDKIVEIDGCFRHTSCLRFDFSMTGFTNFTCDNCTSITQESDFRARVCREHGALEKRGRRDTGNGRRLDYLRSDEAAMEHRNTKEKSRQLERELWVLRARSMRDKASRRSFAGVQTEMANRNDVLSFCRRIIQAWRDGLWGGREALWEFMKDVSQNLLRKKEGHRFSKTSKVMWEVVKLRAGPAIANFLTANLHGPSFTTTKRQSKKGFRYVAGESADQFRHIGTTYAKLKVKHGIVGPVPFMLAEDETSIRQMIRWISVDDTLQGFCGVQGDGHDCLATFVVHVGDNEIGYNTIVDAFADNVRAGYARVMLVNPLHEALPALLIVAICTCNSFQAHDIKQQWSRVEKLWSDNCLELAGPLIGHASDGDSRRRCVMLHNYYRHSAKPDRNFEVGWEGFDLKAQVDSNGNVNGLDDQDWIHNVKKLISPLDSISRLLWLGPSVVRMEHIQKVFNSLTYDEHGLSSDDVHRKDRQNFKSAQCLCSRRVVECLVAMRTNPQYGPPERTEGTEMYLEIVGDYVDIFASRTLNLRDRLVLASKVMWFLKLWRLFIAHGEHGVDIPKLAVNFISQQCFIDIVMSCHYVVLLVKLFREKFPSLPVPLSRTGSDVCEIFFSKVGGMAGVERSYDFGDLLRASDTLNRQAEIEGDEDGVRFPRAHRKMQNVWELLHPIAEGVPLADLGDYTSVSTDSEIIDALKDGFTEAQRKLRVLGMAPSANCSSQRSRWFRVPWQFSQPLQKSLMELEESIPEVGDNGEKDNAVSDATENPVENNANQEAGRDEAEEDVAAALANADPVDMRGPEFDAALQMSTRSERTKTVNEVQHVVHEMQEVVQGQSAESNVNEALGKKISPMVSLPGRDNEYIWKARLVSQLNGNPFLSKDRQHRVKGGRNLYYSAEELRRLKDANSGASLSCGHDIAVLFEGVRPTSESAANGILGRRGDRAVGVSQKTSARAFIEIGRVQVIRKKNGRKYNLQREILDMESEGSACIELYCYWYTCPDARRFTRFRYDGVDKCWITLDSVIQIVNLTFVPRQNVYTLDATDSVNLLEYLKLHGKGSTS